MLPLKQIQCDFVFCLLLFADDGPISSFEGRSSSGRRLFQTPLSSGRSAMWKTMQLSASYVQAESAARTVLTFFWPAV